MFERFTHQARAVVADAQRQARRLGHDHTGCEHLLLAVASADHGVGRALHDLGVTPESVESAALGLVGPGLTRASTRVSVGRGAAQDAGRRY